MSSVCPTLSTMPLLSILAEALELGDEIVGADGQGGQAVDAFAVGDVGADEAGLRVASGDRHARHRRALRVDEAAGDGAGRLLRERRGAERQQHAHRHASNAEALLMSIGPPASGGASGMRAPT